MTQFSVVIPCFNAEATITETLHSICAQTLADFEVICVDDGSSDKTRDLITQAQSHDPRVRLVRNTGKGPSDARNLGAICFAQGDIIAFCDADDLWAPTKLAVLKRVFETETCDAVFSKIGFFQNSPSDVQTFSNVPSGALTIADLLGENPVGTMSNLSIRKDQFIVSSGFNSDIVHNEDLEWLIRLIGLGACIIGVDQTLTYYRANPHGLSADLPAMMQGRNAALRTAKAFGFIPSGADQAIHMRYLARRALRVGVDRTDALKFAMRGLVKSPVGFFRSPRRGALTLCGAVAALVLPRRTRQSLFSR